MTTKPHSTPLEFCINIDNVLAQTSNQWCEFITVKSRGRVRLAYDDLVSSNYWECRDAQGQQLTYAEWQQISPLFYSEEWLLSLAPLGCAMEALRTLALHGRIQLVASRPQSARQVTLD